MPGGTFYVKKGDRLPILQATLVDGNGNAVNLTGATVTFSMANSAGTLVITDGSCTIVSATGGVVSYAWGSSDTTTAGTFTGEFEVTIGGLVQRFPNDSNIFIVITSNLG